MLMGYFGLILHGKLDKNCKGWIWKQVRMCYVILEYDGDTEEQREWNVEALYWR
jgi:hypothetical protein